MTTQTPPLSDFSFSTLRAFTSRLEEIATEASHQHYRLDAWRNGVQERRLRDRATNRAWWQWWLTPEEAAELYHFCGIAHRIANAIPEEATREPFVWEDAGDKTIDRIATLDLQAKVCEAASLGRAIGGAAILIGSFDPRVDVSLPIDDQTPGEVAYLKVLDRRDLEIAKRYDSPEDVRGNPKAGDPSHYKVCGGSTAWHASRFVFFGGATTAPTEKRRNDGWDFSIFQASEETLSSFEAAWANAGMMLDRSQQAVYQLKDWARKVAKLGPEQAARLMFQADMERSIGNAIVIDREEDFKNVAMAFSGIAELLDRMAYKLAGEQGFPVTKLLGQAPAGMNATGESDDRNFLAHVASFQRQRLYAPAQRLGTLIANGFGETPPYLSFVPLWIESPSELAARRKLVLEGDEILIANNFATPTQVATHRLVDDNWDSPVHIDEPPTTAVLDEPVASEAAAPEAAAPTTAPAGTAKLQLPVTPTDAATVIKVRQLLADLGLPPMGNEDDELTLPEFQAKRAAVIAQAAAALSGEDTNAQTTAEGAATGEGGAEGDASEDETSTSSSSSGSS